MLEQILDRKREEVAALKKQKSFRAALKEKKVAVIAEIKRRSPSKGEIASIPDPVALAKEYIEGGAAAISVLTDKEGFGGSLDDLRAIRRAFPDFPLLRKDFIVDLLQIEESARAGASAVLLIVKVLGSKTAAFIEKAKQMGLDALVEVHDEDELKVAIDAGADIIGINNRNLSTFAVDMLTCQRLAPLIPDSIVKVAESGLTGPISNFDAVLIGEALVKSSDRKKLIQDCSHDSH